MQIVINTPFTFNGQLYQRGEPVVDNELGAAMVAAGYATFKTSPQESNASFSLDSSGNLIGLVSGDGEIISFQGASYTFQNLPPASAQNAGASVRVTDIGVSGVGTIWISDGSRWMPLNGSAFVARNSIPMIMPSSGSMGNNGAITLTTALPTTYPKCYLYLPENAISAGSSAGIYYAEMTNTTQGIVYNNTYTGGTPTVPTKVAFVTTGPGAYTQSTSTEIALLYATLPGGSLGIYGGVRCTYTLNYNNSAGVKTFRSKYGAYTFHTASPSTTVVYVGKTEIVNSADASIQRSLTNDTLSGFSIGSATALPAPGSVNSTVSQNATLTCSLQTATDYLVLVSGAIEITG